GRRFWGFGLCFCFGFRQGRSSSRRGGKVGISRFWRDSQGSVGAGGNLLLVFAGFHAPVFSTALFLRREVQLFSPVAVAPHDVGAVADGNGFVQVFVNRY